MYLLRMESTKMLDDGSTVPGPMEYRHESFATLDEARGYAHQLVREGWPVHDIESVETGIRYAVSAEQPTMDLGVGIAFVLVLAALLALAVTLSVS